MPGPGAGDRHAAPELRGLERPGGDSTGSGSTCAGRRRAGSGWPPSPSTRRCSLGPGAASGPLCVPVGSWKTPWRWPKSPGCLKSKIRVLDSTALYDAVATQDTVTQLRAAIRKVLTIVDGALAERIRLGPHPRRRLRHLGKPPCDWDDPAAREALVDALVARRLRSPSGSWTVSRSAAAPRRRPSCWPWWPARTSPRATTGSSASCAAWPRTGSSRSSTPRPATATSRPTGASTVTKPTSASTRRVRDHHRPRPPPRPMPMTTTPSTNSWPRCSTRSTMTDASPDGRGRRRLWRRGHPGQAPSDLGIEVMAKLAPVRNTTGGFSKDRFVVDVAAGTVDLSGRTDRRHHRHRRRRGQGVLRRPVHDLSAPKRPARAPSGGVRSPSTHCLTPGIPLDRCRDLEALLRRKEMPGLSMQFRVIYARPGRPGQSYHGLQRVPPRD